MDSLHFFFIRLQFLTCFFIVLSSNPIHAILFLVLLFFESTVILLLCNVDFIALLFVIIYVGAIAVLFLFVVMMLKIKSQTFSNKLLFPLIVFSSLILFEVYTLFNKYNNFGLSTIIYNNSLLQMISPINIDTLSDVEIIGQMLYNYYLICFIVVGLILLIAMVGAIILTLNTNKSRQNMVSFRRLSRTDKFLSFFK